MTYLRKWIEAMNKCDLSKPLANQRRTDASDHPLGVLSDDMAKMFVFLSGLEEEITEATKKLDDLYGCLRTELEILGGHFGKEKGIKYGSEVYAIVSQIYQTTFTYHIIRQVFDEMLRVTFDTVDGKPVLGIRENFSVVCRKHDDRGDGRNPLGVLIQSIRRFVDTDDTEDSFLKNLAVPIAFVLRKKGVSEKKTSSEPTATPRAPTT